MDELELREFDKLIGEAVREGERNRVRYTLAGVISRLESDNAAKDAEIARLQKAIEIGIRRGMVTVPFYEHEVQYSRVAKDIEDFLEACRLAGGE